MRMNGRTSVAIEQTERTERTERTDASGTGGGGRRRELRLLSKEERQRQQKAMEEVVSAARVVCCTLSGAASKALNGEVFDLVVIDEAAQARWGRSLWCHRPRGGTGGHRRPLEWTGAEVKPL